MAPSATRIKAAVNAMEELGVNPATTRSVVKKLFKICSNRWKPIEEENYQFLANSIFEMQVEKERESAAKALVLMVERSRGRGGRRTKLARNPDQIELVDEDEAPIAVFPPPHLLATGSVEQSSKVEHSNGDPSTGESRASGIKGRCGTRRSSFDHDNVEGESCHIVEIASLAKKDVMFAPTRARRVDPEDIANGNEMLRIPLAVKDGDRHDIPHFYYISENKIFKDARVNVSLSQISDDGCCSGCYGNCMNTSSTSCACVLKNGGDYAYTAEGLLSEDFLNSCIHRKRYPLNNFDYCRICPMERIKNETKVSTCKGHLRRIFIKECWSKCGCNSQCGNRVVQRRMYPNLEVFYRGQKKGWGVRTLEDLPRGAFVCEYVGEVLTNKEHYERTINATGNKRQIYSMTLDADWASKDSLKDEEALFLDATIFGNVARFINRRCYDANLVEVPVEIEIPGHHYYHVAFFATRTIKTHEELNWDYGIDFGDQRPSTKAFECHCKSRYCRDRNRRSKS